MRKGRSPRIIAKNTVDLWMAAILFLAAFLRLYRLIDLSEFLGDQGRTMLVMRDFLERGIIPVSGPTTLSGHALGPAFYYLLAPGYLLTGGVTGVVYWVAAAGILSVWMLYETVKRMVGIWQARIVALMYAVSRLIVASDRTIWEPNLVPLFSILFVFLLYRAHHEMKPFLWVGLGAVSGILLQLHYPNVYFLFLLAAYAGWMAVADVANRRRILSAAFFVAGGALVVLLPFIVQQMSVGFRDILGVMAIMRDGGGGVLGKRTIVFFFVDYASRVIGRAIPFMTKEIAAVFIALWGLFVLRYPTKRHMFLSVWFIGGTAAMARYSGVVYDHYLSFLVPAPFLMIASVLSVIRSAPWKGAAVAAAVLVSVGSLLRTDVFAPGGGDISRVRAAVSYIKEDARGEPFSFTLIDGKSFSDLHYRYFMDVLRIEPSPIAASGYRRLYLVCDRNASCPDAASVAQMRAVTALCYDEHCSGSYPTIPLAENWSYVGTGAASVAEASGWRIYSFRRK